VDVDREDVCDMILDKNSAKSFESAVDQQVRCQGFSGILILFSSTGTNCFWMTCLCGEW
jgi:hypothetical protein